MIHMSGTRMEAMNNATMEIMMKPTTVSTTVQKQNVETVMSGNLKEELKSVMIRMKIKAIAARSVRMQSAEMAMFGTLTAVNSNVTTTILIQLTTALLAKMPFVETILSGPQEKVRMNNVMMGIVLRLIAV